MEEDLIFVVLDGSHLEDLSLDGAAAAAATTGAVIADAVAAVAAPALKGLPLPEGVRSGALSRLPDGFLAAEFAAEEAPARARDYLDAVIAQLKEEPIVISVLDGRPIRVILDDEDDFAMLAEHLFTDLDDKDTGKLSKGEIKTALESMGVDLGVPPSSEMSHLLPGILKKHGAEGEEELGQAQFAQLLQLVLQDLVDALAKNRITVIHNVKILNGSKIRKILADPNIFDAMVEKMHQDWDDQKVKEPNRKRLIALLDSICGHLGLPSSEENQAVSVLYQQILAGIKEQVDGELCGTSFKDVVQYVFEKLGAQLEATPIFC